jgi:hypothetical protein
LKWLAVATHSTLNVPTGTVAANAALVTINPSTSESVTVYSSNDTDLVLDITGYFAPASLAPSGLSLYTLPPCRVIDTRESSGEFQGELTVPFATGNNCSIPTNAQAYVVNATVVPSGSLGFLTLWPDGIPQPLVSTLNAEDGAITSNMAIVSTTNGSIDTFASSDTQLILDVSGYFAPPPGPTVVILGDSIVNAWLTPQVLAQNPTWAAQGSPAGVVEETSSEVLARFPAAIALKPQIILILTGTWDMTPTGSGMLECTDETIIGQPLCSKIEEMVQEAQAAGIYCIFGTLPPRGTDVDPSGEDEQINANINLYNHFFADNFYHYSTEVPQFAEFHQALAIPVDGFDDGVAYEPQYTTDGVLPNSQGAAVMTTVAQQAIAATLFNIANPTFRRNPHGLDR